MLMATMVAPAACLAGESAAVQPKVPKYSVPLGCADDPETVPGKAEHGCGEDMNCLSDKYVAIDVHALFNSVVGDKPVFPCLKNQKVGGLKYNVGGELRYRYMDEQNRFRPPGPGQSSYQLWRFTPFVEATYNDFIGGYVQAIDASMFGLDAPYTPIAAEINRADLLQCYVDLNFGEVGEAKLKYRYGRQFLHYGGQRLLSSLGWANTYRNFEGHKLMYASEDWDIDAFAMQSLNGVAGSPWRPYSFDQADQNRWISGVYSTWKGIENNNLDLYYLYFDNSESSTTLMDGSRHTLGARLAGKQPVTNGGKLTGTWNWDVEGAWQFGEDNFGSPAYRDVQAGMCGAIGGYTFEDVSWKPGLGGIFYWASGSDDPTTGRINTFYTLYPLLHGYWGQIDNLSGQNLLDYGVQVSLKPHEKLSIVNQWHYFDLAQSSDSIYNVAGTALAGSGESNIGNELDLLATWTHSKSFNLQMGYFMFFYGDAVTNGPLNRPNAELLYLQATYTF